jgi:hypothetical protein
MKSKKPVQSLAELFKEKGEVPKPAGKCKYCGGIGRHTEDCTRDFGGMLSHQQYNELAGNQRVVGNPDVPLSSRNEGVLIDGWEKTLFENWPDEVEIDKRSFPAIKNLLQRQRQQAIEECIETARQTLIEDGEVWDFETSELRKALKKLLED